MSTIDWEKLATFSAVNLLALEGDLEGNVRREIQARRQAIEEKKQKKRKRKKKKRALGGKK